MSRPRAAQKSATCSLRSFWGWRVGGCTWWTFIYACDWRANVEELSQREAARRFGLRATTRAMWRVSPSGRPRDERPRPERIRTARQRLRHRPAARAALLRQPGAEASHPRRCQLRDRGHRAQADHSHCPRWGDLANAFQHLPARCALLGDPVSTVTERT